jgi:hypothetical protein
VRERARERRAVRQAAAHRLNLVDGQGGGARGGDRRVGDPQRHPDHGQRRRGSERPGAVVGRDPRHAHNGEDREHEQRD